MVQLSKRKIKPEAMNKMFSILFNVLGEQNNQTQFNTILNGLFSPVEKIMIAKRVAIFFLLLKGEEWKTIHDTVKVSLSSISKCQMILLNNSAIRNTLAFLSKKKSIALFLDEFFLTFFGPGTAYTNWKNGWKIKNDLARKKEEVL